MSTIDPSTPMFPMVHTPRTSLTLDKFRAWVESDAFPQNGRITFIQGSLFIETNRHQQLVQVPDCGMTFDEFRAWAASDEFPERGRITYLNGRLIIDMSPERLYLHTKIKGELTYVLTGIVKESNLGEFFPDGARVSNRDAGVSNEPDAVFAAWSTFDSGRVTPSPDRSDDCQVDLVGTPDWVCEIVSDSSELKDTRRLFKAYHKAGIPEYWLIDAREADIEFQLFVWSPNGYRAAEPRDGWLASPVFGRQFQLIRFRNQGGRWEYELRQRAPMA
jgi:Uma2 family endonuclease